MTQIVKCSTCRHRLATKHSGSKSGRIITIFDRVKQHKMVNHKGNKNKTRCPNWEPLTEEQIQARLNKKQPKKTIRV